MIFAFSFKKNAFVFRAANIDFPYSLQKNLISIFCISGALLLISCFVNILVVFRKDQGPQSSGYDKDIVAFKNDEVQQCQKNQAYQ